MQTVAIVTPANSYDLTTLAAVKAELNLTTTAEDSNIAVWITQASASCAAYCDTPFVQEVIVETFRNRNEYPVRNDYTRNIAKIVLKRSPVTITSIVQDGTTLVADVDYQLDPSEGIIYRLDPNSDSLTNWFFGKLVVSYTGGYAVVPSSVSRACVQQVVNERASAGRDNTIKQESIPGVLETQYWVGTIGQNGGLTPEVTALLDPFRNVGV